MAEQVRIYATDGQRILCESGIAQAEIARRINAPRQRVNDWMAGRQRPTSDWRRSLDRECICPVDAWDRPPGVAPASKPMVSPPPLAPTFAVVTPSVVEAASQVELEAYGVTGLEAVVDRLREMAPELPPRERVQAITSEGRLHAVIANLRAKERDARSEYLRSPEFASDMRLLSVAVPDGARELRAALGRLGVELPAPAVATSATKRRPPKTALEVELLIRELEVAADWREKGEPFLAAGHVLELCLDAHADEIAAILAESSELAARFLTLLDPADEKIVGAALERRMALADVLRFDVATRNAVAQLFEAHGLDGVARSLGGPS